MTWQAFESFFKKRIVKSMCNKNFKAMLNVDLSKAYNLAFEISVSQNNSIWETWSSVLFLSQELRGLSHSEGRILSNRTNKKSSVPTALPGDPLDYY